MMAASVDAVGGPTESSRRPFSGYIPELDGIRAFAILAVLGLHVGAWGFYSGWAGVPLFFVLSGFLITGILLDARKDSTYFRNFYMRRMVRIFPVYYLLILGFFVFGWVRHLPLSHFGYFFCYFQNNLLSSRWDWWEVHSLGHTWSLAVEEQFYLLWPPLVFFLRRRYLIAVLGVFILVATPLRFWASARWGSLGVVILPTNIDALSLGALLALAVRHPKARDVARNGGLALLMFGPIAFGADYLRHQRFENIWEGPGLAAVTAFPFFFAGVLAVTLLRPMKAWSALLRRPVLRYIGKISYGLYLYHWPVFALCDQFCPLVLSRDHYGRWATLFAAVCKMTITFATAMGSWRYFESPINSLKDRFRYHKV